jgi:hypothetical protein
MAKSATRAAFAAPLPAAPARGRIYRSILDTIGAAPLVGIPRLAAE